MENQFFMPIGKRVYIIDIHKEQHSGAFQGFITFGGIPSIFLKEDYDSESNEEKIIPINQVVTFRVIKPKNILL